ncbi:MAG: MFS transporter [Acetobacteraceae bacterium]|nr:MFS transporter [Acetobacteraceae bacterium]
MTQALGYCALLRLPRIATLLAATGLARLASRMFVLAIVLYALDRFHDPGFAGWLSFAAMAPGLATSPLSGAILDRIGAPRAILLDMAASAALLVALAGTAWAGFDSRTLLVGLVGLFSLTSPLSAAGIRTLLPRLVPPTVLDRANALDTLVHGLVDVTGPALAGLLAAFAEPPVTLLAIAALYAAAAVCLHGVRGTGGVASRPRPLLRQAAEGLLTVARTPTLRGLVASYALYQVGWGVLLVAVPVLIARDVGSGAARDTLTGALWAASGAAGILGALLAGQVRAIHRERRFMALGMLATALALYPVAARGEVAGLAVGLAVAGLVAGPIDVGVLTLRQRRTPPERLGRVLAVSMSLNLAGIPLGSALGGWLLGWAPDMALPAAALAAGLAALACWRLVPAHDP